MMTAPKLGSGRTMAMSGRFGSAISGTGIWADAPSAVNTVTSKTRFEHFTINSFGSLRSDAGQPSDPERTGIRQWCSTPPRVPCSSGEPVGIPRGRVTRFRPPRMSATSPAGLERTRPAGETTGWASIESRSARQVLTLVVGGNRQFPVCGSRKSHTLAVGEGVTKHTGRPDQVRLGRRRLPTAAAAAAVSKVYTGCTPFFIIASRCQGQCTNDYTLGFVGQPVSIRPPVSPAPGPSQERDPLLRERAAAARTGPCAGGPDPWRSRSHARAQVILWIDADSASRRWCSSRSMLSVQDDWSSSCGGAK